MGKVVTESSYAFIALKKRYSNHYSSYLHLKIR